MSAKAKSASGVPPLNLKAQSRDGSATLPAPTGRKKLAQGKDAASAPDAALGNGSQNTSSPEGAKELPHGWRWVTLRGIASIAGGVTKGQKRRANELVRKVPCLRVANVQRGYLDLNEVKEIEASESEIEALRLQSGDVLFNEGGDRDKLGRGWIWNAELPECVHQNHVFRARLIDSRNSPKFTSYYGNSVGQKYFYDEGKHTTNLASINLTKLGALPIPLPSPVEQRRVVAEIERQFTRLEAGVAALRRVQANLKRYRAAVLKAACEGQLVPTEAELHRHRKAKTAKLKTGAELLTRILAERRKNWTGRSKYKEPVAPNVAMLPPTVAVPFPPLAEQTRIVAEVERRLSVVEELEPVVSANLQRAVRLRQSILQKAFSGELA